MEPSSSIEKYNKKPKKNLYDPASLKVLVYTCITVKKFSYHLVNTTDDKMYWNLSSQLQILKWCMVGGESNQNMYQNYNSK